MATSKVKEAAQRREKRMASRPFLARFLKSKERLCDMTKYLQYGFSREAYLEIIRETCSPIYARLYYAETNAEEDRTHTQKKYLSDARAFTDLMEKTISRFRVVLSGTSAEKK